MSEHTGVDGLSDGVLSGVDTSIGAEAYQNKLLGYRFLPDGKREVRLVDGKEELFELPEELLLPFSGKFKDKHRQTLMAIAEFGRQASAANRTVALLQDEAIKNGLDKSVIKDLERLGLIETAMVEVKFSGAGSIGGRKAIVVAPQGKAFVKVMEQAMKEFISTEGV